MTAFDRVEGKNMRRIPWKVILYAAGALLLSLLLEYMLVLNFSDFFAACHNRQPQQVYGKNSIECIRCSISEDGTLTAENDSPQILIKGVNSYVSMVDICISDLPCSAVHGKIYWSEETDPGAFSEERSASFLLREDQRSVTVVLNHQVEMLRVDFGLAGKETCQFQTITVNAHAMLYLKHNVFRISAMRVLIYCILILVMLAALYNRARFQKIAFQYRWWIGLTVIVVCTALKLHGSSIGVLTEWLTGADTSKLWLQGRPIRSDEFVGFTQMALSQAKSGFGWFSDVWGYSPSDMFIVYGQPIMNPVALYRPFSAGYLLLGAEYGLSFYWVSRLVVCWLVSFEFGRIITKDQRGLSVAYAFLIALSPVVQWWFSINELVEMLIFGQGAVVLFHLFFRVNGAETARRLICKASIVIGLVICSGGYILTLYPPWMVPVFYVFLASGIAYMADHRREICLKREDLVLFLAGIALLIGSMAYIYHVSGDTVQAVMNTEYPGKRVYAGGRIEDVVLLFRGWISYLWSFVDSPNSCEMVGFISFFPLGLLLSLEVVFREKKRDIWLIILNLTSIFLVSYLLIEMPAMVGNLTLMSSSSSRLVNAVGMINLIILFRAVSISKRDLGTGWVLTANIAVVISVLFAFYHTGSLLTPSLRCVVMIVALTLTNILLRYHQEAFRRLFLVSVIIVSVVGGALVNPVSSGLGTLYRSDVIQAIDAINKDAEGMWAVNGPFVYANLPAVVGAKTITALATYPDFQLWKDLGLTDEESEMVWNRYAHMELEIGEETRVTLGQSADDVRLFVTLEDLQKLGVQYILSTESLETEESLTCLYARNGFQIYQLDPVASEYG